MGDLIVVVATCTVGGAVAALVTGVRRVGLRLWLAGIVLFLLAVLVWPVNPAGLWPILLVNILAALAYRHRAPAPAPPVDERQVATATAMRIRRHVLRRGLADTRSPEGRRAERGRGRLAAAMEDIPDVMGWPHGSEHLGHERCPHCTSCITCPGHPPPCQHEPAGNGRPHPPELGGSHTTWP